MKIVIMDFKLEDYVCSPILDGRTMEPLNEEQFKEYLSAMDTNWLPNENIEIYFVDVEDKTWNKFKTKNSKRLELTLDQLNELLQKSSSLYLIKESRVETCRRYSKND